MQVIANLAHVRQLVRQLQESRRSARAAAAFLRCAERSDRPEALDVLIPGAGLSGIGAA
ncbi:hypothetical protein ACVBEH_06960 [Roseateles sp. GG27B]